MESDKQEYIEYSYPEELFEEGYPTQEALDYIKNWGSTIIDGKLTFGKYFSESSYEKLIEYIKSIWTYDYAIIYEDGLLEIHTYGWSGNELIVRELEQTNLWMFKFRAHQVGGHYYFKIDSNSKYDFWVEKRKHL